MKETKTQREARYVIEAKRAKNLRWGKSIEERRALYAKRKPSH